MDPATAALVVGTIGAGVDLAGNLFQKKQADTAHQREVKDLIAAGMNPALTAGTTGSAVPEAPRMGENLQRGLNSALAVQRQKAEIDLMQSQSLAAKAQARSTTIAGSAMESKVPLELADLQTRIEQGQMSFKEKQTMLPELIAQVRAQALASTSSAGRSDALAALDRLAKEGAFYDAELAKDLGEMGPAGRLLLKVLQTLR